MKKERIAEARSFAELVDAGVSVVQVSAKFGRSYGYVAGLLRQYRFYVRDSADHQAFDVVKLPTPITATGDFMVIGDVHVPCTDYDFANLVLRVADKNKIGKLIIAGDLFNMDAFSTYDAITRQPTWGEERDAARILFRDWCNSFDEIYVLMGNHDRRLQKWTRGNLDETDIIGMITTSSKIKTSNFGYITAKSPSGDWLITHSKNYSINQLTVASELASKYQANIISHHEHHAAIGWDRYKRYIIVNNGGLFDQKKLAYTQLDTSKSPNMMNGFTMLKNGVPRLYSKYPFTDWAQELN